ncbi:MAG: sigma-70 family RNA polymerase sigma factor [Pseudomonas sp.]|uniref:RNA polymerase sigma factor n=1 Tax=Pseudomonas sp. TaxID=306 RepID=UPI0027192181|nr:sigma-70 family RNA polymerase sigma factor [Pseudomonas sp.]MDO8403116.1 sigma-70 family RNA polymerase sigma factor [Pseudomonas sp.]
MADAEADFTALYRAEHTPQVRRAFLLLGDDEAANDVVHEAMTGLYRRWAEVDQPAAYLNRAVLNGCRDAGRRRASTQRTLQRLRPEAAAPPVHEPLADVLATLPFPHRAAIVLRYYAGFTTDEIAEALNCAPGSVGPWIDRGLTAMRKVL